MGARTQGMTVIDIRTRQPLTNVSERVQAQTSKPVAVATRLAVGCTIENGSLRTHRYRDHLVLWDLTNAGKRGKKVTKLNLSPSYTMSAAHRDAIMEQIALLLENLQSYEVAAAVLSQLAEATKQLDLSSTEQRGVDVAPREFTPVTIKTEILDITASYTDFSIRCLTDKNNLPTAVPPTHKSPRKVAQQFYTWVSANQDRVKTMSYRQVLDAMREQGISFHSFCGMD